MTIKRVTAAARPVARRRRLAVLGCAVTVPLVLAACGGGGAQPVPAASPAPTASCPSGTRPAAASGSPSPAVCAATETGGTASAWHGTITATATLTYLNGQTFTGHYTGTLSLTVGPAGAVTGHGQVSQSGCALKVPATSMTFGLRGTDDGRQLRLQIPPASFHLHGGRAGCGFGYGLAGPIPGLNQSSTTMLIPIGPAGTARAHWVVHTQTIARSGSSTFDDTGRYLVDLASG